MSTARPPLIARMLIEAVKEGDAKMVANILDNMDDTDIINFDFAEPDGMSNFTMLMAACRYDQIEVVELLLSRGASVNLQDSSGHTPLMWAVSSGNPKIVRRLLKAGASTRVREHMGTTALSLAERTDKQCAAAIREHEAVKSGCLPEFVAEAVMNSDLDKVASWLDSGGCVDALIHNHPQTSDGSCHNQTMLTIAADFAESMDEAFEHTELTVGQAIVELLLQRGANINHQDSTGGTALMYASAAGSTRITRRLLELGAQTNLRDDRRLTAFQCAAENCREMIHQHVQTARLLELTARTFRRKRETQRTSEKDAEEAAAYEKTQQESARQQAEDATRRAAEFEKQRQAIATEAAAKLAAERKKAEERQAAQRERNAMVEEATRAEQKAALLARKAAEAEAEGNREALRMKKASEDEANERARRQAQSEAKKMAKRAKKESKKKKSPFALQEEQERQAAEERCAEEVKAAELAAALAAEQRERHETERRHAEARLAIEEVQKAAATQQLEEDDDEEKAAPASVLGTTQGNQSSLLADADDETLCIYCLERKRAFLFVPCGHRCLCHVCSGMQWEQCPVCRRPKESLIEVFG